VLVAEVVRARASAEPSPRVGVFALPKEGQQANGDAWSCRRFDGGIAVLACDGLGHGAFASDASSQAVAAFEQAEWRGPKEMVEALHQALRPTRGAAAAVAFIETAAERLRYAGIGNISGCIVSGDATRHLVSQNGILGHSASRISEFEYAFTPRCTLVMHSDGISARWQPLDLGMVWERHPALLAGLLYRDFARGNDDVVAVVINP
jgi:hypothetical protein